MMKELLMAALYLLFIFTNYRKYTKIEWNKFAPYPIVFLSIAIHFIFY